MSILAAVLFLAAGTVDAGQRDSGSISGFTTSQGGGTLLPGVHVRLIDVSSGRLVDETDSNESGAFRFPAVVPGAYRLSAHLAEFDDAESPVIRIRAGDMRSITLDLPIAKVSESIVVRPRDPGSTIEASPSAMPIRPSEIISLGVISGANVSGMLALRPGVILAQGGVIAISGARPAQTGVDVDGASVVDPAVGGGDLSVPSEAIDNIEIAPNPVAGDAGRLTAGLLSVHTKPAPEQLHFSIANFVPEPRFRTDTPGGEAEPCCSVDGIRDFSPRTFLGGPLIRRRLSVAQSLLIEYVNVRVPGLLNVQDTTTRRRLGSFTRFDVPVSSSSQLRIGAGLFSNRTNRLGLARFVPPEATANVRDSSYQLNVTASSVIGQSVILESTLSVRSARAHVFAAGSTDMFVSPEGRSGTYFNDQVRDTSTVQWKEVLTKESSAWAGQHAFKVGFDVLRGSYTGSSASRSVKVLREDGSLAEQITFLAPSNQSARATDGALFVSDAWKPRPRVRLEPTVRLEFDGVLGRTNLAPRLGSAIGLKEDGSIAIRGAVGLFHERPPLAAVTFSSFEPFAITRVAADGTPLGPTERFSETVAEPLQTPTSVIWNVAYDHNVGPHLALSATYLERTGSHELLIRPEEQTPDSGRIVLDSTGRSVYREAAIWAKYQNAPMHFTISYVRSTAQGDLNSADDFISSIRDPFVRPNQYGPTSRDIPNRVVGWVAVPFVWHSTLSLVGEWHSGAPFSMLDALWNYVGVRNSRRFPAYRNLDLSIARDVGLGKRRIRLYLRAYRLLNVFNPVEVQNNITSPAFGTFYSTLGRRFAIDFDLIQ